MAAPTPAVQRVTSTSTIGASGAIVPAYVVTFTVGIDGPFTLTVPADQFTAAHVQQQMQAVAAELAQLPRQVG